MFEWWTSLTPVGQFFWSVAIFASVMQVFLFVGILLGGVPDLDHGVDLTDTGTDAVHGVQLVSLRVMVAGAVGFGWGGVLATQQGWSVGRTTGAAVVSGLVFMGLVYGAMRVLFSMRDDGTLDYRNAVGLTGKVYATIPAHRSAPGQVELLLQGRLITAPAICDAAAPLPPNTFVRVEALEGQTTLVVAPS